MQEIVWRANVFAGGKDSAIHMFDVVSIKYYNTPKDSVVIATENIYPPPRLQCCFAGIPPFYQRERGWPVEGTNPIAVCNSDATIDK